HRRLFAADVSARARVDVDLDRVALPEGRPAEVALVARLPDGALETRLGEVQLVAHVDVGDVRADPVAADDAALHAGVGIELHQRAVLVSARLALVGVDDEIVRFGADGLRHEAPLDAHGKTSAPAPADVRLLRFVDNLLAGHRVEHPARDLVTAEIALVHRQGEALRLGVRAG